MQQFGASMFYKVVYLQKLVEVENDDIWHNNIVLAILVSKITKVSWNLIKLWQKQFWLFFPETRCIFNIVTKNLQSILKTLLEY